MQDDIKEQILIKPDTHYRGYQRLGANVTRYEEGYQRDWHEAIDLYREQSPHVSSGLGNDAQYMHCNHQSPMLTCMQPASTRA